MYWNSIGTNTIRFLNIMKLICTKKKIINFKIKKKDDRGELLDNLGTMKLCNLRSKEFKSRSRFIGFNKVLVVFT